MVVKCWSCKEIFTWNTCIPSSMPVQHQTNTLFLSSCSTNAVQYISFRWWHLGFSWHPLYCLLCWKTAILSGVLLDIAVDLAQLRSIWNAGIQPVERHVESSVATICPLIWNSTDTFKADIHIARPTSRYTSSRKKKKKENKIQAKWIEAIRVGVMIPALSSVIAFGGRSWKTQERDDKGFVYGSNTHFIKAFCRKLKHDRSNTGLNAFSSFPIFPFQHIHLVSVLFSPL